MRADFLHRCVRCENGQRVFKPLGVNSLRNDVLNVTLIVSSRARRSDEVFRLEIVNLCSYRSLIDVQRKSVDTNQVFGN